MMSLDFAFDFASDFSSYCEWEYAQRNTSPRNIVVLLPRLGHLVGT